MGVEILSAWFSISARCGWFGGFLFHSTICCSFDLSMVGFAFMVISSLFSGGLVILSFICYGLTDFHWFGLGELCVILWAVRMTSCSASLQLLADFWQFAGFCWSVMKGRSVLAVWLGPHVALAKLMTCLAAMCWTACNGPRFGWISACSIFSLVVCLFCN